MQYLAPIRKKRAFLFTGKLVDRPETIAEIVSIIDKGIYIYRYFFKVFSLIV